MSGTDSTYRGLDEKQQAAVAEIAAHPERKALANLYSACSALVGMVFITVAFTTPAVIWWAYSMATR